MAFVFPYVLSFWFVLITPSLFSPTEIRACGFRSSQVCVWEAIFADSICKTLGKFARRFCPPKQGFLGNVGPQHRYRDN